MGKLTSTKAYRQERRKRLNELAEEGKRLQKLLEEHHRRRTRQRYQEHLTEHENPEYADVWAFLFLLAVLAGTYVGLTW